LLYQLSYAPRTGGLMLLNFVAGKKKMRFMLVFERCARFMPFCCTETVEK